MPDEIQGETLTTWVERAQLGQSEAYEVLARTYLRPAYLVALAILGRPADAEDVAQDAMVVAFDRLRALRDPARFGAWLTTIARNQALNALARRRRHEVRAAPESYEPSTSPRPVEAIGLRERLLAALDTLTPPQREVVLLHDLEGWSHAEIALAIGSSEVMSRQHLFQARRLLRRRVQE